MKRPRQSMRRYTWALAVLCFLAVLLAAPLLFSDRYSRIALQSGAVFAASNNTYSLSSPVRLMNAPAIELESGTLSVPPHRTGLARGGQVIAMLITGGPPMTLANATFTADFSAREPTFSQAGSGGLDVAPLVDALRKMQFNGLVVRDSTVRMKMADGSLVELENVDATIDAQPAGSIVASGSFDFHGEKVSFDTTLGASLDAQGMSRPVTASFTGAPLVATLDGRLLLGENPQLLAPQAEFTASDLRATARWLGVNWPGEKSLGTFHAKGQLEWVGRNVAFQNAALELDDNNATGTFSINFSGARPMIEGTLGLKTLDLTEYWKASDGAGARGSLLATVRGASGLEFPLIQAIDADFRISSESLSLPATTIGRSAVTLSLRNGKMLADIAELEFEDGTRGSGQLRIDMSGANPNYSVQAKFEATDVGGPAQVVFGHPTLQGRGAITVDLNATGNTGESLLRSLGGKFHVTLLEGGRVGLDINTLAAPESQPLSVGTWHDVSTRAISVDRLDARFAVDKGVFRTQAVEAVSGERALRANGTISLPDRNLDMQLAVGDVAKPAADGQDTGQDAGKTVLSLQPREIINVRGPWAAPDLRTGPPVDKALQYGPPDPG